MSKAPPPVATLAERVVDEIFGERVEDPYRWLEDGASPAVAAWTDAQNARTRAYLDAFPGRDRIHARLRDLLQIGLVTAPEVRVAKDGTTRYFHLARAAGQNQHVLYVREGVSGTSRTLVDPNPLSPDGTTALDWHYESWDGRLVAYGLSEGGSEDSTLYVRDVATGADLPDVIARARFASVAWLPSGEGFYYSRYPEKGAVPPGDERYHRHIHFHRLGTDPAKDPLVFGEGREKTDSPSVAISPNGRWLVVYVHQSWSRAEVWLLDLEKGGAPVPIVTGVEALTYPHLEDDRLVLVTNDGSPRFRVDVLPLDGGVDPSRRRTLIAESDDVLQDVSIVGGSLYAIYLRDVTSRVVRFDRDGTFVREIPLPGLGAVDSVRGPLRGGEAFVDYTSFDTPPTVLRVDEASGDVAVWAKVDARFDASAFHVRQRKTRSKDGTLVPYFVVSRRDRADDGTAPVLIHAYGGFNISLRPELRRASIYFLEAGGVVVVANLRGGGELGESWHRAGMREAKQNVFDDLFAVAEDVAAAKIGARDRLSFWGGSNGGLLAAVAVVQRPDLFRAVVSAVPLTDMVRFPRFLIARMWTGEYGDPAKEDEFRWLYAYSPYHHVEDGRAYPAVLFTTAESDTRVDPMHARKMAARLQAATSSDEPVVLRVETRAGHGAGKPVSKQVEELTDVFSFLFAELGMSAAG